MAPRRPDEGALLRVTHSAWVDLVFHGLAHLPVDDRDASRLHDPGYVAWAAERLTGSARTLPLDAVRLAGIYDGTAEAPLLQALAVLHEDPAELVTTASRPFAELQWRDEAHAALAGRLAAALPEALTDLFRIALWGEVKAGYLELRERELVPQYAPAAAAFAAEMARLGARCAWLASRSYCLSHPLLAAGRGFQRPGEPEALVVVGLEDERFGVPPGAPVVQAVHEAMVDLAQAQRPADDGRAGCRADRPGFAEHLGPEVVALCLGARLLARDPLARAHEEWLARLVPGGVAEATAALEEAGLRPRHRGDGGADPRALARWLAAGDAVPEGYEETWQRASARAGRRR
jgi:hypothetical protein